MHRNDFLLTIPMISAPAFIPMRWSRRVYVVDDAVVLFRLATAEETKKTKDAIAPAAGNWRSASGLDDDAIAQDAARPLLQCEST